MSAHDIKSRPFRMALDWLKANLPQDQYLRIERDSLSAQLDLSVNTINRTLLVLTNSGVILSRREGAINAYKATDQLAQYSAGGVYTLVDAYNKAAQQRSLQKKLDRPDLALHNQLSLDEGSASDSLTTAQTMPLPALPLTPAQLLLKQAQALVDAEQQHPPADYEQRLKTLEQKLDNLLSIFQQAGQLVGQDGHKLAHEIASTESWPNSLVADGDEPLDPDSTRGKLVQIVRAYGVYKNVKHRNIWTWLYEKLNRFYRFNAAQHRASEKETYLDAVERCGQLENLYTIAKRYLDEPTQTQQNAQ